MSTFLTYEQWCKQKWERSRDNFGPPTKEALIKDMVDSLVMLSGMPLDLATPYAIEEIEKILKAEYENYLSVSANIYQLAQTIQQINR